MFGPCSDIDQWTEQRSFYSYSSFLVPFHYTNDAEPKLLLCLFGISFFFPLKLVIGIQGLRKGLVLRTLKPVLSGPVLASFQMHFNSMVQVDD